MAKLLTEAGLVVVAAFVSPFRADRETTRSLFGEGEFLEVFVDVALEVAAERDTKGLYAKARAGEIPGLTGIGGAYEPPEHPDVHLDMTELGIEEAADRIVAVLGDRELL